MQKFNKWDSKLAKLIKISFLKFNKIYGYKMLTLIINKIYNLSLKAHMVYRYMKYLNLKSVQRIKKFKYKLSSGPFRYENLLSQNFRTTELNQKLRTDITYFLTNKKTYYLSIVKDFHNNQILDYQISNNLGTNFVLKNIINAWIKAGKPKTWILQSDQGFHYTN
ncbi:hypothetical protein M0C40_09585 [Spiroplasma citri]|uniref:Transposase n=1 Tax=Spiroplasma citri TaxID=2133 RepID=A0AAX3SYL4_SPICI|nr:hypothetical protein [Spiroplasma citri]WFG96308.1 hypothetical protein M0C40_09585 [Spiroplasma citri]